MLVIALTGGIGSGKTSVAMQLAQLGAGVIDADQVAREVVVPGSQSLAKIVAAFGAEVLSPEGTLNRPLLRARVFADPAARARLETILHPPIREVMRQRLAALHTPYAVLVIPLLIETGQTDLADRVLVVDLPEAEQIRRVRERDGMDETSVRRILGAQCDRPTRLRAADDILDNSGDPAHLREQAERLHHHYLALAREPSHSARPRVNSP